ncbi:MAG TPA: HAMP domain-containing sensor histidine kinase [Acidimicrobiales bacterium]|nr:HAMP domain-containing sensor histidine kinase [Acidimicrobiales bacterium]
MNVAKPASLGHAVRVAVLATAVVGVLYLAVAGVFDVIVVDRLVGQVDVRLLDRLHDATRFPGPEPFQTPSPGVLPPPARGDADVEAAPVFLWRVGANGKVLASESGAPTLMPRSWSTTGAPVSTALGAGAFRLQAVRFDGGWLVAGLSLAEERHVESLLFAGEAIAGPIALLGMFLGSWIIGLKASAPVEVVRRRQLEFTADASHELRTPLSVIEAEVDLALGVKRDAASYRQTLERVGGESQRLLRIVEDLLWLARFDSTPPPPAREPIDLATIAEGCAERFRAPARARDIELHVDRSGSHPPWITAPPEWIDRLAGVLIDNACRYTPPGGKVHVSVGARAGRVTLAVEDSGPGIAPEERSHLFDRFHRSTDTPGGTGLGLAIGDAIVRSTGGRWHIAESALRGARMEVSWHRFSRRDGASSAAKGPPG